MAEEQTTVTLRAWPTAPTPDQLASALESIAAMIRNGYTSGEALTDDDYVGRGWWFIEGDVDNGPE